jgi:Carboxypeptidase regulatory-like domain/TonB dependent receptor
MNSKRLQFASLLMFVSVFCASIHAQMATGTISGQVQDSSGGVVPNAKVAIVHTSTGQNRRLVTNERGEFLAPLMPIGEYEVSAEFTGFKRQTLSGILLRVDQTVSLPIRLEPGNLSETVQVEGRAPLLESETSSLGQVIENRKVVDMPLNGRNVFALGLLSGFTTEVSGMGTNQTFASGGGRFEGNEIMLDGIADDTVMNRGSSGRNSILYTPSVDAVEEFKVKTSDFSAEFGHSAGAVVSATIKSGSNQLHGTLFEFLRNDDLDANNFFSNAASQRKPPFRQNQFGGSFGGPIYLPKLYNGHDRTFFFIDYQGTRRRTIASSQIYDLPSMALRQGDFSSLPQTIYNFGSRRIGPAGTVISDPYPDNRIPASLLSPTALAIEAQIPAPNFGSPGANSRNYFSQPRIRVNQDQFDIRGDHKISQANSLFGRFSFGNDVEPQPGFIPGPLGPGSTQVIFGRHAVLNDVHVFSPTTINEFRFGFTRSNGSSISQALQSAPFAQQVGMMMFPFPVPGFPALDFSPSGQISGQVLYHSVGGGGSNLNFENTFQFVDNITKIRGNHAIKFGGDLRRHRLDQLSGSTGDVYFGSIFSSSSNTPGSGDPWADFLTGFPSLEDPGRRMLQWGRLRDLYAGLYLQDDWKITRRLTLNLGVRYDLYTQPVDARDVGGQFDINTQQFVLPGKNGYTRAIVNGDHNNIAPRIGLAYQITPKLVVRSAYGIFYGLREQNDQTTNFYGNIPNVPTFVSPTITASGTVTPPLTLSTPAVFSATDPTLQGITAANPVAITIQTESFNNVVNPYLQQWNFSLQYELKNNWLIQASYQGAKGTKLGIRTNLNQVPFAYALEGLNTQANRPLYKINGTGGYSVGVANNKYEAVNFRLEKRFGGGLNFLANYTISKNLETGGSGDSSYNQNGSTSLPLYTYDTSRDNGPAPLDIPQRLVTSYGYELPFGKGKHWLGVGGFAGKIVSGWQVNGITTIRSGFPTDIRYAVVPPTFATFNVPNRVPGVSMYVANPGPDQYLNPAAFSVPGTVLSAKGATIQLFGNSARHVARGPGAVNFDFSLFKNTNITERMKLQFRAESFNLTNTPTFLLPSANSVTLAVGQPTFGKLSQGTAVGRQIQFGMKLLF